jgi:hypothetical protein
MNSMRILKGLTIAVATSMAFGAFADTGGVPQASINLSGATLSYCNTSENSWTVTKTSNAPLVEGQPTITSPASIMWTVTATKNGSSSPAPTPNATICAEGTITIANGGAAPATLGNIVVNLQKNVKVNGKNKWVSAAANVADATNGDGATSANIVATASAEDPASNCVSPNSTACNYAVSGAAGTFTETSGISGSIQFTDVNSNDAWSLSPAVSIPLSTPVTLKYKATFVNKVFDINGNVTGGLNIADGASLRTEVIVSFGNAGGRGGSGASASGIDINGDGNPNDGNVRSVPIRLMSSVPAWVNCNNDLSLADVLTSTGTVAYGANSTSLPSGTISSSQTFTYSTPVLSGAGSISNTVDYVGSPNAETNADCCTTEEGSASASVIVLEPGCEGECGTPDPRCDADHPELCLVNGAFCTYSQGGWLQNPSGNNAGQLLKTYFGAAFPNGLTVGSTTVGDLTDGGLFAMRFDTSDDVAGFKTGGSPGTLTSDLINPATSSAGNLGSQMTALTIALGMSGVGTFPAGFGSLTVSTVAGPMTIAQFHALASTALSGGGLGPFPSLSYLTGLAAELNVSFEACQVSGWALQNLSMGSN